MQIMTDHVTLTRKGLVITERRMFSGHRFLGYLTIILQSLVCSLLIYALIIGSGNILVCGCQKIGFYNFCLYNKTMEDCQCVSHLKDLPLGGRTSQQGLLLSIILTYISLVIVITGIMTMTFAQCFEERNLWTFSLVLNLVSLIGLSLGMVIFLFLTWDIFDIYQVTPGFLAILAALGGMSVLLCIIRNNANLLSHMSKFRMGQAFSYVKL